MADFLGGRISYSYYNAITPILVFVDFKIIAYFLLSNILQISRSFCDAISP